jgi:hypothetical protein
MLHAPLRALFLKYFGENSPSEFGHLFDFVIRSIDEVMSLDRKSVV